ncbi:F0F1 ATP synthase subunit A [Ancrocorticia populi]|uniref:F0F1 ATP synthase subunit A n=1 Tax=Ancrocorticia populi TaxID=2175228 RepID=UPI001FB02602|nr:F0F1 ATP synthase subunit A [Ancrocorticia populi]
MLVSLAAASATTLADGDSSWHVPGLEEFFPEPFLFEGTPFEINRLILVRLIAVVLLAIVFGLYARRAKLVPGRAQAVVEFGLDFVRKQIGHEIIGEEKSDRYMPLLATIFFGTLFMNLTGVIPGLQIAATSVIGMPLVYAVVAYVGFIVAGIKEQGAGHFFKNQLMPPGMPKVLYLLMTPIEFLSTFIIRPLTLTIRLLANMVAGHMILVLCFVGTNFLYTGMGGAAGIGLGSLTLVAGIIFVAFEIFIGALQAYIFALLSAVYISLSIEEH